MSEKDETTRQSRSLNGLGRFLQDVAWFIVGAFVVYVAIDHNQVKELEKQRLRLSVYLLELQIAEYDN